MFTRSQGRGAAAMGAAVALAAMAFWLATAPRLHLWDPFGYLGQLRQGTPFHPHHLLHNVLGAGALTVWEASTEGAAMDVVTRLNMACGALGLGLIAAAAWLLTRRTALVAAGSALLVVSYGWWSLATTWEPQPVAGLFVGAALLALAGRPLRTPGGEGALIGALHALAVLFHQTAVLGVPAFGLALWLRSEPGTRRRRLGAYGALLLALVGGGYGGALAFEGLRAGGSDTDPATWVVRDAVHNAPSKRPEGEPLLELTKGLAGSLVLTSPIDCAGEPVQNARRGAKKPYVPAVALSLGLLLLVVTPMVASGRPWLRRRRDLVALCGGWAAIAVPFVAWWEPRNYEYFLVPTSLAVFLGLVATSDWLEGLPAPRGQRLLVGLPAAWLVLATAVGLHNWDHDRRSLSTVGGETRLCWLGARQHPGGAGAGHAPAGAGAGHAPAEAGAGHAPAGAGAGHAPAGQRALDPYDPAATPPAGAHQAPQQHPAPQHHGEPPSGQVPGQQPSRAPLHPPPHGP